MGRDGGHHVLALGFPSRIHGTSHLSALNCRSNRDDQHDDSKDEEKNDKGHCGWEKGNVEHFLIGAAEMIRRAVPVCRKPRQTMASAFFTLGTGKILTVCSIAAVSPTVSAAMLNYNEPGALWNSQYCSNRLFLRRAAPTRQKNWRRPCFMIRMCVCCRIEWH